MKAIVLQSGKSFVARLEAAGQVVFTSHFYDSQAEDISEQVHVGQIEGEAFVSVVASPAGKRVVKEATFYNAGGSDSTLVLAIDDGTSQHILYRVLVGSGGAVILSQLGDDVTTIPGLPGDDGITPHIGENGNWFIGETDTGVLAEGQDGDDGVGIQSIALHATDGKKKTYRITFTDTSTFDYDVWDGEDGDDGDSAYLYIAYADDDQGTGFTTTFDPAKNYVAIKETTTEIATPTASDFTGLWKNYKGGDGREVEMQNDGTYLQWRYVGEEDWENLFELPEDGGDGANVELREHEGYVQWRLADQTPEGTWENLFEVPTGKEVEMRYHEGEVQWRYADQDPADTWKKVVDQFEHWFGTQAQYEGIDPKDENTIYYVEHIA